MWARSRQAPQLKRPQHPVHIGDREDPDPAVPGDDDGTPDPLEHRSLKEVRDILGLIHDEAWLVEDDVLDSGAGSLTRRDSLDRCRIDQADEPFAVQHRKGRKRRGTK